MWSALVTVLLGCGERPSVVPPVEPPPSPPTGSVVPGVEGTVSFVGRSPAAPMERYGWRAARFTVPRGIDLLEVEVSVGSGEVELVVQAADRDPTCALVVERNYRCTIEDPDTVGWSVDLITTDGAEDVAFQWRWIGLPEEPFLLGQIDVRGDGSLELELGDVLGELQLDVQGEGVSLSSVDGAACAEDHCLWTFPPATSLRTEAKADDGVLHAAWLPATMVFVGEVDGKMEVEVEHPFRTAQIRTAPDVGVEVFVDGISVCTGMGGCVLHEPSPGVWEVQTTTPATVRIGGMLGPLEPIEPDEPDEPIPDHPDDIFSAEVIDSPTVIEAALDRQADHDWFLLELGGSVRVYTTGPTDTHGTVLRGPGDMLASDDDSGEDTNFSLIVEEASGIWLDVRGFSPNTTGPYVLVVERLEG